MQIYIRIIEMQVLRKLSEFAGAVINRSPPPVLKHKKSSYRPATRIEKIKDENFRHPSSSEDKFVFISNMDGTGFQREVYLNCPTNIPLTWMIN